MNFTRWLTLAVLALSAAPACSEAPYEPLNSDAGLTADAGSACDLCGGRHLDACQAAWDACEADPGCVAIRDCVFDHPVAVGQAPRPGGACALTGDGTGAAACVTACFVTECTSTASIELYLAAEQCTYCGDFCATDCSGYCAALPTAPTCAN